MHEGKLEQQPRLLKILVSVLTPLYNSNDVAGSAMAVLRLAAAGSAVDAALHLPTAVGIITCATTVGRLLSACDHTWSCMLCLLCRRPLQDFTD